MLHDRHHRNLPSTDVTARPSSQTPVVCLHGTQPVPESVFSKRLSFFLNLTYASRSRPCCSWAHGGNKSRVCLARFVQPVTARRARCRLPGMGDFSQAVAGPPLRRLLPGHTRPPSLEEDMPVPQPWRRSLVGAVRSESRRGGCSCHKGGPRSGAGQRPSVNPVPGGRMRDEGEEATRERVTI